MRSQGREEGCQLGIQEGREEGIAEGIARAVVQVLAARHVEILDHDRDAILACRDERTLSTWLNRATVISDIRDLFSPRPE